MTEALNRTLDEQGFRYVRRGSEFRWVHPLEVDFHDIDCTDMSDVEFESVVRDWEANRD